MSPIPKKGSFSFLFPIEYPLNRDSSNSESNKNDTTEQYVLPSTDCILQQPPEILNATCNLKVVEKRVQLTVTELSSPLTRFFQIRIPNYRSQRSTALSSTFEFASFDEKGGILDTQKDYIFVQPTDEAEIHTIIIKSSFQVVAARNSSLDVTFITLSDLKAGDQLRLQVPKWNEMSFKSTSMIDFTQTPSCKGYSGVRPELECSFSLLQDYDLVIIPNAVSVDQPAGSTLKFSIGPFTNPISTRVFDGFQVQTFDSFGGAIASGSGTLKITQQANITQAELLQYESTINKHSIFQLSFDMPVPVEQGCHVTVQIPTSLGLNRLEFVELSGMFGIKKNFTYSIDAASRRVLVENACVRWLENTAQAQITLGLLRNPAYAAKHDSFKVWVVDKNQNRIATVQTNLFVVTTPGSIKVVEASVSNYQVSSTSEFYLQVQPVDYLSKNARLVVHFPSQDILIRPKCQVTLFNKYSNDIMSLCTADTKQNSFTIKNFLSVGYNLDIKEPISVGIGNITMPTSSRPTGDFTIQFYDYYEDGFKLIDQMTVSNLVQALPGEVSAQTVTAQSSLTFTNTTLAFQFRANHAILKGGYITVTVPHPITVMPDARCSNLFVASATCVFDGTNTFNVINAFQSAGEANQMITFSVSQIRSPRTLQQAGYFKIQTRDANGYEIDSSKNYRMNPPTDFNHISFTQLWQSNMVVGAETEVKISLQSPLPIYDDDAILVTLPGSQQSKQLSFTYQSCQGLQELTGDLDCNLQGLDSLRIFVSSQNQVITPGTTFQFLISMVANPDTTEPSSAFLVQIFDSQGFLLTQTSQDQNNLRLKATKPNELIFASVSNADKIAKRSSDFDFQVITNQRMPAYSTLVVTVPSQLQVPKTLMCWISTHPLREWPCEFDSINQIIFRNINPSVLPGGSTLQFQIQKLINSEVSEPTFSFEIATQTQQGYLISEFKTGLTVQADCDYPCKQCTSDPRQCRNCNTEPFEPFSAYLDGQCLESCPDTFFRFGNICSQCSNNCLLCSGSSKGCTKCHAGQFLLGSTCLDVCPDTHYDDSEQRLCVPCEMPCSTCSTSPQTCTSCARENNSLVNFFRNKCYEKCPYLISVFQDFQCQECSDGCKTCEGTTDTCRSCVNPNKYLNLQDNKCIDQCPGEVTVAAFTPGGAQTKTCELCDQSCFTCDLKNKNLCTRCKQGYKFERKSQKCLLECPVSSVSLYIPLTNDLVCVDCPDGCQKCDYANEVSHCTVCDAGKVLFNFTCIETCPKFYMPNQDQTCVAEHQLCDYGYYWHENQCQLAVAECQEGYIMNQNDTKCIPVPGFHMPGIFILAALVWTIAVLHKGKKIPHSRIVIVNQLIIGYAMVQFIGSTVMFILSYQLGYSLITALHLAVMISNYALNVAGWITWQKTFMKDLAFVHWAADSNDKTVKGIRIASVLVSFKLVRFCTSELFQKKFFSSEISDKFRLYTRPLMVITAVGFIVNVLPLLFVSAYTIWLIPIFGYEIRSLSFESIVLSLTIVALEIFEFIYYFRLEKKHPKISDLLLREKTKKTVKISDLMVKSVYDDMSYENMARPTDMSQVDLLIGLNKQLDEKRKLVDLIRDSEPAMMTNQSVSMNKKQYITERRQNFEQRETGMPMRFNNVPDIEVADYLVQMEKIENKLQAEDSGLLKNMEKLGFLRNNDAYSIGKSVKKQRTQSVSQIGSSEKRKTENKRAGPTNFEIYETRSENEVKRDNTEFARIYKDQSERLISKFKCKQSVVSFDDEYLREIYDNFGVCSDFESQLSHFSWPPPNHDQVYGNPRLMAQVEFLGDKIKSKFKYCNIRVTAVPSKKTKQAQIVSKTNGTQTVQQVVADPFESENESIESKPEIDPEYCNQLFVQVYDGLSDSQPQQTKRSDSFNNLSRNLATVFQESNDQELQKQASISLFNQHPLSISSTDNNKIVTSSNHDAIQPEISKEEQEDSLSSVEKNNSDQPVNIQLQESLTLTAHQEQQQLWLTKKAESTSGLNDETKDDVNYSSAVGDQTPLNHIIGQYESEPSQKPMQPIQDFTITKVKKEGRPIIRNRHSSLGGFNDVNSTFNLQAPRPFMKLGVDSLPFASRKTLKQQQQILNDQNRSYGIDKISSIQTVYRAKLGNHSALARPMVASTTDAYYKAHQRHTVSALKRMDPKGLRKQNFVEDGQLIVGSQKAITAAKLNKNLLSKDKMTVDSEAKEIKGNKSLANEIKRWVDADRMSHK